MNFQKQYFQVYAVHYEPANNKNHNFLKSIPLDTDLYVSLSWTNYHSNGLFKL